MSALGQKQTCAAHKADVRFTPKADMCSAQAHVRLVPIADIAKLFDELPREPQLSHYRSITVFAGISSGNPGVLPKVSRRCSHVSSCSGVFGMVT